MGEAQKKQKRRSTPKSRDDFSKDVIEQLARRVNSHCSKPGCRRWTTGPRDDSAKSVCIGVAAHITAAAKGGARYDPSLTPEQRRSADNGIWLCQNHAKLVDNDPSRFTVDELREWKRSAEAEARDQLESSEAPAATGVAQAAAARRSEVASQTILAALRFAEALKAQTAGLIFHAKYAGRRQADDQLRHFADVMDRIKDQQIAFGEAGQRAEAYLPDDAVHAVRVLKSQYTEIDQGWLLWSIFSHPGEGGSPLIAAQGLSRCEAAKDAISPVLTDVLQILRQYAATQA
jgi:hypothetical protein